MIRRLCKRSVNLASDPRKKTPWRMWGRWDGSWLGKWGKGWEKCMKDSNLKEMTNLAGNWVEIGANRAWLNFSGAYNRRLCVETSAHRTFKTELPRDLGWKKEVGQISSLTSSIERCILIIPRRYNDSEAFGQNCWQQHSLGWVWDPRKRNRSRWERRPAL